MVKTPVNYTQKGTPYGVGAHVMLWSVEVRKENKMQRACPFLTVKRSSLVAGLKRAPHR